LATSENFLSFAFTFSVRKSYAYSAKDRFAGQVVIVSKRRHDLEAQFDRMLSEHGAAVSRLAYSYEAVGGIREELVQEIALAIWQALPHFRGECSERTFVFRIAHNRGLTHVSRRRPRQRSLDDLEEADEPADPALIPTSNWHK
jgi:DNA-directed RNA polymerase specialized sigma24 family protein